MTYRGSVKDGRISYKYVHHGGGPSKTEQIARQLNVKMMRDKMSHFLFLATHIAPCPHYHIQHSYKSHLLVYVSIHGA